MIFGSVAKTLVGISAAGLAAAVAWPNLANYVYPNGAERVAVLRDKLPKTITSMLPAYGDVKTAAAAQGRPSGGPPNAGGRPGAGGPPAGAQRGGGGPPVGRGRGPRRPVPVIVAKATKGEVPYIVDALGSTRAFATVNVKTRVDSLIQKIHVKDGAKVTAGDILVELDKRQIDAQIRQAEAALAKDTAENQQAKRDVERFAELLARRTGTKINLENARLKVATTAAAIEADKAQIENLKVQRSYYTITAPISGRIGIFNVKEGNTIRAGDNTPTGVLVNITQSTPIYVSFSLPQSYLPEIRKAIDTGVGEVLATPQGASRHATGKLTLIDNAIDTQTGTVTVHALFDNKDEFLWPGQLCDLRIILRRDQNVVSIPREATQSGQDGNFVFTIEEGVARVKQVRVLRSQDGRDIITEGLNGDETVVLEGGLSLRNGTRVQIRNERQAQRRN